MNEKNKKRVKGGRGRRRIRRSVKERKQTAWQEDWQVVEAYEKITTTLFTNPRLYD